MSENPAIEPEFDLDDLDEEFDDVEPMTDPTPGDYQCRIDRATMGTTKDGSKYMLKFELIIVKPQKFEGAKLFMNLVITNEEKSLRFLKRDLLKLGYEGTLSALKKDDTLEYFIDKHIEVNVTNKGGMTNVRLIKMIEIDVDDDDHDEAPPDEWEQPKKTRRKP